MKKLLITGAVLTALSACNGEYNPLTNPKPAESDLPPGTENPSAGSSIERYEAEDGNGYAQSITYDKAKNTFHVDNLAFDAANVYTQDDVVPTLGNYRVYENPAVYADDITGKPINQLPHKAILGQSKNTDADGHPVTQFAIVRTGGYRPYGFGGFMYERNGGVVLPDAGQATFSGDYAGLRDHNTKGDIEYVTGDIDFNDLNAGDAVKGQISGRKIFDVAGNEVTGKYTTELGTSTLPVVLFKIGSGTMSPTGEITGELDSSYYDAAENKTVVYESGKSYAVLAGEGDDMEVTGVVVIESADPTLDGNIARETGGFILYR